MSSYPHTKQKMATSELANIDKQLYGKHAQNLMKTDVYENEEDYEMDMDLPGFKKVKNNEDKKTTQSDNAAAFSVSVQKNDTQDPNRKALSTTEIVDKVSPATVSVFIMGEINGENQKIAAGSGFIISESGYMITNAHVVSPVVSYPSCWIEVMIPGFDNSINRNRLMLYGRINRKQH